jgi:chromosome segregation ATPase
VISSHIVISNLQSDNVLKDEAFHSLTTNFTLTRKSLNEMEVHLKEAQCEIQKLAVLNDQLKCEYDTLTRKTEQDEHHLNEYLQESRVSREKIERLVSEKSELEIKFVSLQECLKIQETTAKVLHEEVEIAKKLNSDNLVLISDLQSQKEACVAKIASFETDLKLDVSALSTDELTPRLLNVLDYFTAIEEKIRICQSQITTLQDQNNELTSKLSACKELNEELMACKALCDKVI